MSLLVLGKLLTGTAWPAATQLALRLYSTTRAVRSQQTATGTAEVGLACPCCVSAWHGTSAGDTAQGVRHVIAPQQPCRAVQVGRLNHVAIAVPDLNAAAERYRSVLGAKVSELVLCSTLSWLMGLPCAQCTDTLEAFKRLEGAGCCCTIELCHSPCCRQPDLPSRPLQVSDPQPVPEHGVTVVFVELPNTKIELLHPLGSKSPIQKFLERNPAGTCGGGTAPSSQACMLAVSRWCTHSLC